MVLFIIIHILLIPQPWIFHKIENFIASTGTYVALSWITFKHCMWFSATYVIPNPIKYGKIYLYQNQTKPWIPERHDYGRDDNQTSRKPGLWNRSYMKPIFQKIAQMDLEHFHDHALPQFQEWRRPGNRHDTLTGTSVSFHFSVLPR